ncbi:kinesin-like protein KIF16B [Tubulanus polymorphus]|uniref:kinesin-like protein KIF16B n=1 Tax=Tubulanus polymorphus TaxID=672921 RepID=UPI003DA2D475
MASVKVAVRVRPINEREKRMESDIIISMNAKTTTITNTKLPVSLGQTVGDVGREREKKFTFDFSYCTMDRTDKNYASQEQVFNDIGKDVINFAYDGYNACIFAYGQTGSGKTYTMMGTEADEGLIPRICHGLFSKMVSRDMDEVTYRVEVSYLEIYNEKVRDLLCPAKDNAELHTLRVREHPKYGPYVQELSNHIVANYSDVKELMDKGNVQRTTASTNMNDTSSRSHAIFTIKFTQAKFNKNMPSEMTSKINLVDLAGSERADATGATGQRLKEGASINKSLVTLGNVISLLADMSEKKGRQAYIPYRDSVLTWLLKDSLGGNAKTIMVATISPADVNYAESLSTLRYANRAKDIINKPTVNEDPNVKLIRELRAEIDRLKALLGGNIDKMTSPKVQERLHENEARIKVLTDEWTGKWKEAHHILREQRMELRKEGLGVILDSELPHLIGIDDDILSTGIMLYHLKEGKTTIGTGEAELEQNIVLAGLELKSEHCVIENDNGVVTLYPLSPMCMVNGAYVRDQVQLKQGAVILLGKTNMFRFNNPAEAQQLRKDRETGSNANLSRTSFLSQSISDIARSTDNLSACWEMEDRNTKQLEELEEKRRQIEELEDKFRQAEEARLLEQKEKEDELEAKRLFLDKLKLDAERTKNEVQRLQENLRRKSIDMEKQIQEHQIEKERLREEKLEINKEKELKHIENEQNVIEKLKEELCIAQRLANGENIEITDDFSSPNTELYVEKHKLLEREKKLHQYVTDREKQLTERKDKCKKNIEEERQKLTEAGEELAKRQKEVKNKLELVETDEQRKILEQEWAELDQIEEELKEFELTLDSKQSEEEAEIGRESQELKEYSQNEAALLDENKKLVANRENENITVIRQDIENRYRNVEKMERTIEELNNSILAAVAAESEYIQKIDIDIEYKESETDESIGISESDEDYLADESGDAEKEIDEIAEEMIKLAEEKKQEIEIEEDSQKLERKETDLEKLQAKIKEMEECKQQFVQGEEELEEKRRAFEDERQREQERIELEKYKLQEMENEERINALVEQEVKQRLFEEKVQREKQRRMEREKERKEREDEMTKMKRQHDREMQQLRQQYESRLNVEQSSPARLSPNIFNHNGPQTIANPYASHMSPEANTNREKIRQKYEDNDRPHFHPSPTRLTASEAIQMIIPTFTLRGYGIDAHYEFEVKITVNEDTWSIFRRYSKFRELHARLKHLYPDVTALAFPPKRFFGNRSEKIVAERRGQLESYLRNIIEICARHPCCPLHPNKNKAITKHVLVEFSQFFKKGVFESSKHTTG